MKTIKVVSLETSVFGRLVKNICLPVFMYGIYIYNSKELSVVIRIVKHKYICLFYYNEGSNNDMFRPYMWAIFRL